MAPRLPILLLAVILTLSSLSAALPQADDGCRYFAETGHYVCQPFLSFYDTYGQQEIFGYPITRAFTDPVLGIQVQSFQRARMEYRPDNPLGYQVQLGLLVDELGYTFPPVQPSQVPRFNSSRHRYFPETQHVVSYAFLDYFEQAGGLRVFGYPRSEFMYEDGYIVQYFQRAKMEWHPEVVSGSQMRLANLGEVYVDRFEVPEGVQDPEPSPLRMETGTMPANQAVTALNISPSVEDVITGREGTQTVFVYVNDQHKDPLEGVTVEVSSRDQLLCPATVTDARGFAVCEFELQSPLSPGRKVIVDVKATYGGLVGRAQTFYLPWW